MVHPCINHDLKFPKNPMHCKGQLCSDCPFTEKFKEQRKRENAKKPFH